MIPVVIMRTIAHTRTVFTLDQVCEMLQAACSL